MVGERRPDPEQLLRRVQAEEERQKRGRLRRTAEPRRHSPQARPRTES